MASARIEHVNLSVRDPERTAKLMTDLFGWQERWRGPSVGGGWTIHVGTERDYLALYTGDEVPEAAFRKGIPLNHVGVEVDDLDATEARVVAAGLAPFSHGNYEPGTRFYFFDPDGIEYEIVSYA